MLEKAKGLAKQLKYEEALQLFQQVKGAEGAYGEGACLYKLGRHNEAREALNRCLEIDPFFERADILLKKLTPESSSGFSLPPTKTIPPQVPGINMSDQAWKTEDKFREFKKPQKMFDTNNLTPLQGCSVLLFIVIGVIVWGLIYGLVSKPSSSPTNNVSPNIQKLPISSPTGWRTVKVFQGSSIKNTETFYISSREWRISWITRPGKYGDMNFQIYVYEDKQNSFPQVVANVIGYSKDSSIMRGSGNYYLTINSAQEYTITIEQRY